MILRVTAAPFLVCCWCAAQATQDSGELERRLHLVEAERSHGRLATAESMLANLQADIERTAGSSFLLVAALREHGLLRDDAGHSKEAIPFFERALELLRARPVRSPVSEGLVLANLASSHADCGDSDVALSLSSEAMTLLLSVGNRTDPGFALSLYAHGVALHSLGRNSEALRDQREALDIRRHSANPDYQQIALIDDVIAGCLSDLGYLTQAEASEREALAIREKILDANSLAFAASLNNLAVILARAKRFSEARQSLESAALLIEQREESEQERLPDVLGNLGAVYYAQAQNSAPLYAKAEEVYRRKLAAEERMFGPSDVRVAATLETLGEILYRERAYNEAGRIYGRGLAIQQAQFGSGDPTTRAATKRYNSLVKKMTVDAAK